MVELVEYFDDYEESEEDGEHVQLVESGLVSAETEQVGNVE